MSDELDSQAAYHNLNRSSNKSVRITAPPNPTLRIDVHIHDRTSDEMETRSSTYLTPTLPQQARARVMKQKDKTGNFSSKSS